MHSTSLNNKGFGLAGILAIALVVSIATGAGAYVYHKDHKQKTTATTSTSASGTTSTSSSSKNSTSTTATTDPYAGWKQYCDTQAKICFKYPATWTETSSVSPEGTLNFVSASLESPDHSASSIYQFPDTKDGNNFNFLTTSISSVPGLPSLDVVGGIYTNAPGASNYAQYAVVSTSTVSEDGLSVGSISQFVNTPRFQLPENISGNSQISDGDYQFIAIDEQSVGTTNYSLTSAKAWFSTQNAKDSLLSLESLSQQ